MKMKNSNSKKGEKQRELSHESRKTIPRRKCSTCHRGVSIIGNKKQHEIYFTC